MVTEQLCVRSLTFLLTVAPVTVIASAVFISPEGMHARVQVQHAWSMVIRFTPGRVGWAHRPTNGCLLHTPSEYVGALANECSVVHTASSACS